MKLPGETGRKENMAATIVWIILIIVYYCAVSQLLRGYIIPGSTGLKSILSDELSTFCIIVVCVVLALLTARFLFRICLQLKAYHVRKRQGWQAWRREKQEKGFAGDKGGMPS